MGAGLGDADARRARLIKALQDTDGVPSSRGPSADARRARLIKALQAQPDAAACAVAVRQFMPGSDFPLLEGRSRSPTGRDTPYIDISRIRRDASYEPKYMPIERAIEDCAAWLRDHDE